MQDACIPCSRCEWCCDLMCYSRPALKAHSDFLSVSLFHVCLCACSRSLEMSLKAGCCLCGRTALSAWILLFLLHFSHLSFLEAVLKEFHFLGLHLLPPGLFKCLRRNLFIYSSAREIFQWGRDVEQAEKKPKQLQVLWETLSWEWFKPGVNIATVFIVFWYSRGRRITWVFATYLQCVDSI